MGRKRKKTFKREKDQEQSREELIARRVAETLANTSDRQPLRDPSARESESDSESVEPAGEELADVDAEAGEEIPGVPATDSDAVEAASPEFAPTAGESTVEGFRPAPEQAAIQRQQAEHAPGSVETGSESPEMAGETETLDSVRTVLSSQGQSLDRSLQSEMEQRLGERFSDVQIHTGPKAAKACEEVDARAFTVGNNVVFNSGEYDPESVEGQHLIAHELVHTRQQTDSRQPVESNAGFEIDPDPRMEREAEQAAQEAVSVTGDQPQIAAAGTMGIQRMARDESLEISEEEKDRTIKSIIQETDLSESAAKEMVIEASSQEELDKLHTHVTSLNNTSIIDGLGAPTQHTVARILIEHTNRGVQLLNELESPNAFYMLTVNTDGYNIPQNFQEDVKMALASAHGGNWIESDGVESIANNIQALEDNEKVEGVARLLDGRGKGKSPPNGLTPVQYSGPGKGNFDGARYELDTLKEESETLSDSEKLELGVEMSYDEISLHEDQKKKIVNAIPGYNKKKLNEAINNLKSTNAEFEGMRISANGDICLECKNYSESSLNVKSMMENLQKKAAYMFIYELMKNKSIEEINMVVIAPKHITEKLREGFNPEWLTYRPSPDKLSKQN